MKTLLTSLLTVLTVITMSAQIPIDTVGRLMLSMGEADARYGTGQQTFYEPGTDNTYTGILYAKYDNGNYLSIQEFSDGIGNGRWIDFDPMGRVTRIGTYTNNKVEGPVTEYYESGTIKSTGQYLHWKNPIGEWIYYDEDGSEVHRIVYTR